MPIQVNAVSIPPNIFFLLFVYHMTTELSQAFSGFKPKFPNNWKLHIRVLASGKTFNQFQTFCFSKYGPFCDIPGHGNCVNTCY